MARLAEAGNADVRLDKALVNSEGGFRVQGSEAMLEALVYRQESEAERCRLSIRWLLSTGKSRSILSSSSGLGFTRWASLFAPAQAPRAVFACCAKKVAVL